MPTSPTLDLSDEERRQLKRAKIKLADLAEVNASELATRTGLSPRRCQKLVSLSRFQQLDSIGPAAADDLWRLGYRTLSDLENEDPHRMHERLEERTGQSHDPCVEDVFRCAVAQATYPDLPDSLRQWWAWTDRRGEAEVRRPDDVAEGTAAA